MISFSKAVRVTRSVGVATGLALAAAALAQNTAPQDQNPADQAAPDTGLNIPADAQIFGKFDPDVRKPTAIVNDSVITGTDVDQRVALIVAANGVSPTGEELDRLKLQVLRGLIDETLEIQEAKTSEITATSAEIQQGFNRVASNFKKTPDELHAYLRQIGSSDRSLDLQIEAELAWSRYLQREVEPFVNVGDREVQAILDRLKASQGIEEYHLKEIYLSAPADRAQQVRANVQSLMQEIQKGEHPFEYFTQFSEASTRAVGGDLAWVQAAQLPAPLADAAQQLQVGQVAGPIEVPGGYSILYLVDKRQVLTADPRDAKLNLRQLTVNFPAGTTKEQAATRVAQFAEATQAIRGCGDVTNVASRLGAEVVDDDSHTIRDLPPQLQDILLKMSIGQATPPFGSPTEGMRTLVLCGRDDPQGPQLPAPDRVQGQLEQQRVNLRAEQKLRDLRRDAVVEYR